jgi:hypothetical protein
VPETKQTKIASNIGMARKVATVDPLKESHIKPASGIPITKMMVESIVNLLIEYHAFCRIVGKRWLVSSQAIPFHAD